MKGRPSRRLAAWQERWQRELKLHRHGALHTTEMGRGKTAKCGTDALMGYGSQLIGHGL